MSRTACPTQGGGLRSHGAYAVLAACLAVATAIAGCGGKTIVGATAAETAEGFAKSIETGDLEQAAKAFDYVTEARQQNENWDDIPKGQRDLIVKKLQGDKAAALQSVKGRLGGGVEAGSEENGMVRLTGEAGSVTLSFVQVDGKAYIAQVW